MIFLKFIFVAPDAKIRKRKLAACPTHRDKFDCETFFTMFKTVDRDKGKDMISYKPKSKHLR